MINNFRGKNSKDIEEPAETIVSSQIFVHDFLSSQKPAPKLNITAQQVNSDNFDNYIEKMK